MKVGYVRQFIVRILLVSAVFALWGCDKSMELQEIAQCIAPTQGDTGLSAVPPRGLVLLPDKQCYGLQWAIPLAYEPYLFGTPVENLNITMGLLDQTPGAHMTDVRKAREKPEISVYPQVAAEFQDRITAVRNASEEAYGLRSTGRLMYNMEVWMSDKPGAAAAMVMFYPVNGGSSMVVCTVPAQQMIEQIDPLTLCTVTTYIDEHLFAEYHILYSLMPQFDLINSVMIGHILDFLVP